MKISEFAKLCSVSSRSLRHYEKLGLITFERQRNGYRLFTKSHIEIVHQIQWLIKAKVSLKKIKYILPCTVQKFEIQMCDDLKNLFKNEILRIEDEIRALKKSKTILLKTLKNSIPVEK